MIAITELSSLDDCITIAANILNELADEMSSDMFQHWYMVFRTIQQNPTVDRKRPWDPVANTRHGYRKSTIGAIGEMIAAFDLSQTYANISLPQDYQTQVEQHTDIIITEDDKLFTIQVKTIRCNGKNLILDRDWLNEATVDYFSLVDIDDRKNWIVPTGLLVSLIKHDRFVDGDTLPISCGRYDSDRLPRYMYDNRDVYSRPEKINR